MNMLDPLYQSIFYRHLNEWEPDALEKQDIRGIVQLMAMQTTRPMKRSDTLGVAFSTLSLVEGIYERVGTAALTEWAKLSAEIADIEASTAKRPDAGSDSDSGGGAG